MTTACPARRAQWSARHGMRLRIIYWQETNARDPEGRCHASGGMAPPCRTGNCEGPPVPHMYESLWEVTCNSLSTFDHSAARPRDGGLCFPVRLSDETMEPSSTALLCTQISTAPKSRLHRWVGGIIKPNSLSCGAPGQARAFLKSPLVIDDPSIDDIQQMEASWHCLSV